MNLKVVIGIFEQVPFVSVDLGHFRSVGGKRPYGRSPKIDLDRPTSTDRKHYIETMNFDVMLEINMYFRIESCRF